MSINQVKGEKVMKKTTEENLREAFSGESQAHMRYLAFSEKAERENFSNVARLFKANAFAEVIHAHNHLKNLSEVGSTSENIKKAIQGETYEVEEMYPAHIQTARDQGEKGAETSASWALEAEKVHAELYKQAEQAVDKGEDWEYKPIHVCSRCGFTMEGEAPEKCPVCGALKKKFKEF
jgi:rubrerythrin